MEGLNDLVDGRRVDQSLVTKDIHDDLSIQVTCGLGNSLSAVLVVGCRHDHRSTMITYNICDLIAVGSHEYLVKQFSH